MKTHRGIEVNLQALLTSAADEAEWLASPLRPLYPRYPLKRRIHEPQNRSGRGGVEKFFLISLSSTDILVMHYENKHKSINVEQFSRIT